MRLYTLFIIFLCCITASAQNEVTDNPKVDKACKSKYADMSIDAIYAGDDFTICYLSYITIPRLQNGWISLSSGTTLTYKLNGKKYSRKVLEWGTQDGDALRLDKQYQVGADRKYEFYIVFDAIPEEVEKISVNENSKNGFYWEGIHIQKRASESYKENPWKPSREKEDDEGGVWI